jgi:small-conductance mechanosensitive channel
MFIFTQPDIPELPQNFDFRQLVRPGGLIYAVVILALTWLAVRTLTGTLTRLGARLSHRRLLLDQLATIGRFVLYLIGTLVVVAVSINLSKEVVLALTGTAAVAIGFALKDLAASVIAGVIIIIDRPFQVGDRVKFGDVYGDITAIGLRSVRLMTLDCNVVTIPNNKFLTEMVASGNWGALEMMVEMDFFVGPDQDIALAKRLVEECLTTSRYVYLSKPWVVLVNQVIERDYFAVRLRAKAFVLDVQYQLLFHSDVTERVLEAFRAHGGVEPPAVLHRTVEAPRRAKAKERRAA